MRHGEDPEEVLKVLLGGTSHGDFLICPLIAYGEAPRKVENYARSKV